MTRPRPLFYGDEAAILDAMYEVKNGTYDSYSLARKLNPTVQTSTPEAHTAFIKTREATEGLIVKNLVRGERLTGADGVYFNKLKLTPKGEQAAIEQRHATTDSSKLGPEDLDRARNLARELRRAGEDGQEGILAFSPRRFPFQTK